MKKIQYLLAFTIILISCEQKNNTINKEKNKILTKHNSSTQEEKLSSENINDNILNTYVNGNFIIQTQLDNPIKYHKNGIISDLSLITKETNTISDIYIDKTHRKSCSFSKDGKLISLSEYIGGKPHGKQINNYENGKPQHILNYFDELKEGKELFYFENGNIWKSINYELGKLNGLFLVYSSDGKVLFKGEYKKGIAVGNSNKFYENGEIEETCHDGKDFRICISFNENRKITSEVVYNLFTGKKISVSHYDEHGKINEEHFYNDDGDEIDNKSIIEIFDENGNLIK